MSKRQTQTGTIIVGGTFAAPIARVYAPFSDLAERKRLWAASNSAVVLIDKADFRVGGGDVFRFGPTTDTRYLGHSVYHDIVPICRVVSTEVIYHHQTPLSISVATLEFKVLGSGTQLKATIQRVSLDGAVGSEGWDLRYETLAESLERYLAAPAREDVRL